MGKLSKRYVLVDEDLYERKFKNEHSEEKTKKINPFTNPAVVETKKNREEISDARRLDKSFDINDVGLLLQRLVQQYGVNFAKASGKPKGLKAKQPRKEIEEQQQQQPVLQRPMNPGEKSVSKKLSDIKRTHETPVRRPDSGSVSSPDDVVPLSKLPGMKPRRLMSTSPPAHLFVSPSFSLRADVKAMNKDAVNFALGGGHLNPRDSERAKELLVQMRNSGLTNDKFVTKGIKELNMSGKQVKKAIRDMIVSDTSQRRTDDETVKKLVEVLKSKNVKVKLV